MKEEKKKKKLWLRKATIKVKTATAAQEKFYTAKADVIVFHGAKEDERMYAATAKTALGAIYNPGIKILFTCNAAPTYSAFEIVLQIKNILKPLVLAEDIIVEEKGVATEFQFWNGSKIKVIPYRNDTEFDALAGEEYDWVFVADANALCVWATALLGSIIRGANELPKRLYLLAYTNDEEKWKLLADDMDIPLDKWEIIGT